MFAKAVVESDTFLDMPSSAQALYFHLGMEADDEGFLNNPKRVQRSVGAAADDLRLLVSKGFIIPFDSGVVVIRHWKVNNYIQSDRRKDTQCISERAMLETDGGRVYNLTTCVDTGCIQDVSKMDSQYSIGKDRLEENSVGEDRKPSPKPHRHKYGEYQNVLLSDSELGKLKEEFPTDWEQRIERLSEYIASTGKRYKSHLATIRSWARKDKQGQPTSSQQGKPPYEGMVWKDGRWTFDDVYSTL